MAYMFDIAHRHVSFMEYNQIFRLVQSNSWACLKAPMRFVYGRRDDGRINSSGILSWRMEYITLYIGQVMKDEKHTGHVLAFLHVRVQCTTACVDAMQPLSRGSGLLPP